MSLLTILKDVGKDLSHVGTWIEDGLKVAGTVAAVVDPPLGTIITTVETVIASMQAGGNTINAATLQAIVTAVAAALKAIPAAPVVAAPSAT
jgi:hypothetical protein